jgi:hypothetical protein
VNVQQRYWGLFLGDKLIKKINVSWAADFTESQRHFAEITEDAQIWWNTEYRTTRFNIKIKLWTLLRKIKQLKAEDKENDYKYINSIFVRLLTNQGGLTPNEITGLNALAEKYSIVDIPYARVSYISEGEYKVNTDYTIKLNEGNSWDVTVSDTNNKIYNTPELDDAFIYVSQQIAGV